MSDKATVDLGASFAPRHYGVYGEQFPGNTRLELQRGRKKIVPPWRQPPEAHASTTVYDEAYVAWNGHAKPPEPASGRRLVKVPQRPITDFTTATARAALPATAREDVEAARPTLPPGTFEPMGLGAGPGPGKGRGELAGNPAWSDTRNSCYFTSAPGAHTGYTSFKPHPPELSAKWVP